MRFGIRSLVILTYISGLVFIIGSYYHRQLDANPKYATEQLQRIGGGRGLGSFRKPKKSVLDLSGTRVQNEDLKYVKVLSTHRSEIDLSDTKISDAGLVHLHNITARRINLRGTRVTKLGVARLEKTLRHTMVAHSSLDQ